MGTGQPPQPGSDEVWAAYITAKTAAEDDLRSRDLDWTILRPGRLTDTPVTGKIWLASPPVPAATIPRADVAAVIAALLDEPGSVHQTLELVSGDSHIARRCPQHFLIAVPSPPGPGQWGARASGRPGSRGRQLQGRGPGWRSSSPANADTGQLELPIWLPGQDPTNPSPEITCLLTCGKAMKPGSILRSGSARHASSHRTPMTSSYNDRHREDSEIMSSLQRSTERFTSA